MQDCCNGIGSVFWDFGSFRHKPHRKEVTVSPSYLPFQQGPISLNWSRLPPVVTPALDHFWTQIAWTHDSLSSYSTHILLGQDYCLEKRESLLLLPFSKNHLASNAPDGSNQWSFQLTNLSWADVGLMLWHSALLQYLVTIKTVQVLQRGEETLAHIF